MITDGSFIQFRRRLITLIKIKTCYSNKFNYKNVFSITKKKYSHLNLKEKTDSKTASYAALKAVSSLRME